MKSILALKESVQKKSTILLPFLTTTPDSERAIFLTLVRTPQNSGLPLPTVPPIADGGSFFSIEKYNENKITVMSQRNTRTIQRNLDSLTTSEDSKSLFLNNFKSFLNNGITQMKKWKQGRVEMFAHLSRYTPSSITPSNGEGGMVMVFNQIQLPLSRTGSKPNRFGKIVRKNFQQWKYDRMVKQKQERMAEHNRMLKGWLL